MTPRTLAAGLLFVVLVGCGAQPTVTVLEPGERTGEPTRIASVEPGERTGEPTPTAREPQLSGPPPMHFDSGTKTLDVRAFTTCWTHGRSSFCADGVPPDPPPDLGPVGSSVAASFPVDGWRLHVTRSPIGGGPRAAYVPMHVRQTGDQSWTIAVDAPAGTYAVSVFGRGPQGDVALEFQLTVPHTPKDGPMPR